jgi:hypothetical protein
MMATDPRLFGGSMSPQEMQAQLLDQRASQFAQMSPDQQLGMMAYKAGSNVGTGVAGAFGVDVQDPIVRRATKLRELAGQYNTNTAAGIRQMADALRTQDPEMALQLSQKAAAMDLEAAKLTSEKALAEQRVREKQAVDPFQKLVESGKYTPASLADYQKSQKPADLVLYEKPEKAAKTSYGAEADRAAKANFGKDFTDLTQAEAKAIDNLLEARGVNKAKASAAKPVDVASIIKEIGTKEDVKDKATTWKAAGDAYKMQIPMIAKLQEVKEALPKTFTGSFSDTALQFGKGLSALGIPVDRNKLANTEYMNSVSSQVLQTIARNFPGSLAVKEMDQLVKSKFNSQQQIETVSRILGDLQTEIEAGTKSYEQLAKLPETDRYSKDLNYLTGQNFNKLKRYRALEQKANSLSGGQKMTKQEIEEAKKLQSDLGV